MKDYKVLCYSGVSCFPPTAFSSVWTRRRTFLDSILTEGASCFSGSVSAGTGVALSDAIVPAYTPEEIDACEVYTFAWHVGGKIQRSSQKLTASSPLKIDGWKTRFSLGLANFQGRELAGVVGWEGSWRLGSAEPNPEVLGSLSTCSQTRMALKIHQILCDGVLSSQRDSQEMSGTWSYFLEQISVSCWWREDRPPWPRWSGHTMEVARSLQTRINTLRNQVNAMKARGVAGWNTIRRTWLLQNLRSWHSDKDLEVPKKFGRNTSENQRWTPKLMVRVDVSPFPFGCIFQVPFAASFEGCISQSFASHLAWWIVVATTSVDQTSSKNPWQIEALTRRDSDRPGCFGDCEAKKLGVIWAVIHFSLVGCWLFDIGEYTPTEN